MLDRRRPIVGLAMICAPSTGAGMGAALVPKCATRLRAPETAILPLDDRDGAANVELRAATRAGDANPTVKGIIDALLILDRESPAR